MKTGTKIGVYDVDSRWQSIVTEEPVPELDALSDFVMYYIIIEEGSINKETLEFVIYLIHACSHKWGQTPACVYKRLEESGCIDDYLIPHYEVLHTQSTDFVVTDIEEYLEARGNVA